MTDEEIAAWVNQLRTTDYGKQLIALGRLVEAGEAAVPRLFVALSQYPVSGRILVVCALAGIGTRESDVIKASTRFWEANLADIVLSQAMLQWVKKLAAPIDPQNIPALTCFLGCWRKSTMNISSASADPVGQTLSVVAAQALASLSYNHPTLELLQALPYMKGSNFLNGMPHQIETARKTIERNTAHLKDLPRIAAAPKKTDNLPLPAEEESPHG